MEAILIVGALAALFFWVFKNYYERTKLISDDEKFSQYFVTAHYKDGTVTVKNHTFPATAITGIATITKTSGRRDYCSVEIAVDDIRKPLHRIAVPSGFGSSWDKANQLQQRICVAVRKAGGPSFT